MSISFWKVSGAGAVTQDAGSAGAYISRQLGLEARKMRATNALAVFNDPPAAVGAYNAALTKLQDEAGDQFIKLHERATELGYSDDQAKNYATKRCADWLESEIELLDLKHPFAGNTDLMINAKLGGNIFNQQMRVEPDSSVPVDVQQRVPIRGQAMQAGGQKKRTRKTKKGKK
jgi:hypothetical protein